MAHSYTPGLTVSERAVILKHRRLPIPGSVLARQGEQVTADTVVARAELSGSVHAVNVANALGIAPDELPDYLIKREGERVGEGEVIAENRPWIKWFKTEVHAPLEGTIESASTVTGQVLVRGPARPLELRAYVDGRVRDIVPHEGVTVETVGALVQGIFGIGGETSGEVVLAVESPEESLSAARLRADMRGKIVVGGACLGSDVIRRATHLGIAGVVVGGIHDKDLRDLLGYDLGVAITGGEQVGLTLLLTEGFGSIAMATKTFDLLSRAVGRRASLSGATQIRAGVIRPEIIIPLDSIATQASATPSVTPHDRAGITPGATARIIRDPLFGRIGRVVGLPPDLRQIETESRVRVIEVALQDGSIVTIPRANVEIIEDA